VSLPTTGLLHLQIFNACVVKYAVLHLHFDKVDDRTTALYWMVLVYLSALERISPPNHCKLTYTFQNMAAHSACDFRGGRAELGLPKYRQVIWPGMVSNSQLSDEELWNTGRRTLTTLTSFSQGLTLLCTNLLLPEKSKGFNMAHIFRYMMRSQDLELAQNISINMACIFIFLIMICQEICRH